jgi:hypothetical protein
VDCQSLAPGTAKMTSVSFVAPVVVPYPEGILPVADFIQTYKAYGNLVLVFQTKRPFRLTGPASYEDRHLSIRLQQGKGVHRYDVRVTDPHFDALDLPSIVSPAGEGEPADAKRPTTPLALVVALAIGLAASVSAVVYLFLVGRTGSTAARTAR